MNDSIFDLANLYIESDAKVKELDEQLKAAKAERDALNKELAAEMGEQELQSLKYKGKMLFLATRPQVSYDKEREDEFFAALRRNGLADIIRPTVNSRTLTATVMKELAGEDENGNRTIPEWIKPYLSIYEEPAVNMRKG